MFGEQLLRMSTGLLVGIWIARYLGPEKFGVFSYALAFVAIFGSIAKLGLDGIMVRNLVNDPQKQAVYLGTAFWLKLTGALVSIAVLIFAMQLTSNDDTTNLYIIIIASGIIFQSFDVIDFYFQSKVLSKFVSLSKMSQLLLSSLFKVYLVLIGADLIWFVVISVVDQFILAVALVYVYSKQKDEAFYFQFEKAIAKELLSSARPLIISSIMVSIYSSIDRVIIKEMLGVQEVGLYVAATRLTTSLYFIPMLLTNSLFPAILNAKKHSDHIYKRRLSKFYKSMLIMGLFVCVVISCFSISIIHFLYGNQYVGSSQVLQIYIWIFLIICFSSIFGKWLLSEGLLYLMPRFTFMAIVVNIISCFLLIPMWSIRGAAIAALVSQVIPFVWFGITNKEIKSQMQAVFKRS